MILSIQYIISFCISMDIWFLGSTNQTNHQKLLFSKFWWNQSIISLRTVSTNFGLEVKIYLTSDACFVRIPGSIIWLWLQVEGQAMLGQSMNSSLQKSWRPMVIPVSQHWFLVYFKQKLIGKVLGWVLSKLGMVFLVFFLLFFSRLFILEASHDAPHQRTSNETSHNASLRRSARKSSGSIKGRFIRKHIQFNKDIWNINISNSMHILKWAGSPKHCFKMHFIHLIIDN